MLKIPAAAIGTDYTCIPFWEETDLDAYFLPHEDCVSEYVHRGIPADRLYPYGIPVSGAFLRQRTASWQRCTRAMP